MIEFKYGDAGFKVESVEELKRIIEDDLVEDVVGILFTILQMSEDIGEIMDSNPFGFSSEGEDDEK